jgi:hypothetical protein
MIPQAVIAEVESPRFAALLGVVSTLNRFTWAMMQQPAVKTLCSLLTTQADVQHVVARVSDLIQEANDPRYGHPHDLPIAIYLSVLDTCAPDAARRPSELALATRNLWWGKLVAQRVVSAPNRTIPAVTTNFSIPIDGIFIRRSSKSFAFKPSPVVEVITYCNTHATVQTQNAMADESLSELVRAGARIRHYSHAVP